MAAIPCPGTQTTMMASVVLSFVQAIVLVVVLVGLLLFFLR